MPEQSARKASWPRALLCLLGLVFLISLGVAKLVDFFEKPGAQRQAEAMAARIQSETGCVEGLRNLFSENSKVRLLPGQTNFPNDGKVVLPVVLRSGCLSGWFGRGLWDDNGQLKHIFLTKEFDDCVSIGRPTATPAELQLTGPQDVFPVRIADGMYAWVRYR